MSMPNWTQGPWAACDPSDDGVMVVWLSKLWAVKADSGLGYTEHDARLISQSPPWLTL